jgi:hypothetical protein
MVAAGAAERTVREPCDVDVIARVQASGFRAWLYLAPQNVVYRHTYGKVGTGPISGHLARRRTEMMIPEFS